MPAQPSTSEHTPAQPSTSAHTPAAASVVDTPPPSLPSKRSLQEDEADCMVVVSSQPAKKMPPPLLQRSQLCCMREQIEMRLQLQAELAAARSALSVATAAADRLRPPPDVSMEVFLQTSSAAVEWYDAEIRKSIALSAIKRLTEQLQQGTMDACVDEYVAGLCRAVTADAYCLLVRMGAVSKLHCLGAKPEPGSAWKAVCLALMRCGLCNSLGLPNADLDPSAEELGMLTTMAVAFRPAASACVRALVLAGVQSMLDLPKARQLEAREIRAVWDALCAQGCHELALDAAGRPGECVTGEQVIGMLTWLSYTSSTLHVTMRDPQQLKDLHAVRLDTLSKPREGTTHAAVILQQENHYAALVLQRPRNEAEATDAVLYDSLTAHFVSDALVQEVATTIADVVEWPRPRKVARDTTKLQEDACSCGIFSMMRLLCLAATGDASLPDVTDTAWADSCRTLLQAAVYVGDLRSLL